MSELSPDRKARVVLNVVGEPGDPRLLSVVSELGAVEVLAALRAQGSAGQLGEALAGRLRSARPAELYAAAVRRGLRFVVPGDEEWPTCFDDLADAPLLHQRGGVPVGVWVRGPHRLDDLARSAVAVVGARSATSYGTRVAGDIGAELAGAGVTVVSGAAFGIDQAAHRGALAVHGPTLAVLACGADRVYPLAHEQLLTLIGDEGLVLSEAPPGGAPTKVRFLARNRLIAALGQGVVVVEAAVRSGALNTANWADALSRRVMGVPGPVTSASSQGVHQLIRARNGLLVTDGAEVLEAVAASGEHLRVPQAGASRPGDGLDLDQRQVLDAVPVSRAASTDQVARTAGVSPVVAAVALDLLAGLGLVDRGSGGWRLVRAARAPGQSASG